MLDFRQRTSVVVFTVLIFGLWVIGPELIYGQADSVRVQGNTEAAYLTFSGNRTGYPEAPSEGEVFYNSAEQAVKYFDGTTWRSIGGGAGGGKSIATKVVAAANTPNGEARADYFCTGSNDQNTINDAITALGSSGGTVYLAEGTYNLSGPINITTSGVSLIGSGNATILDLVGGTTAISVSSVSGIRIARLYIDGNDRSGSNYGIIFSAVNESYIENVSIMNLVGQCIRLASASTHNRICACRLERASYGSYAIYLYDYANCHYNIICDNIMEGGSTGGSVFLSADFNIVSENSMSNPNFGIYCDYAESNVIINNNFRSNKKGIYMAASPYNVISQNGFFDASEDGIYGNSGNYNLLSGNIFYSNGYGMSLTSYSSNNIVSANIISEDDSTVAGAHSLQISQSGANLVSADRIYSWQNATGNQTGILVNNTSANNFFSGNFVDGSRYEVKVIDEGSSQYTDKLKLTFNPVQFNVTTSAATLSFNSIGCYVKVNSTSGSAGANANVTLGNAHGIGSIVVLENISADSRTITIGSGLGPVNVEGATKILGPGDTVTLIWNGSKWLQIMSSDNG